MKLLHSSSLILSIIRIYKPTVILISILILVSYLLFTHFNLTFDIFIFNVFWNFIRTFYFMSIQYFIYFIFILVFFKVQFFNSLFNLPIIYWSPTIKINMSLFLYFRFTLNLRMYFSRNNWAMIKYLTALLTYFNLFLSFIFVVLSIYKFTLLRNSLCII